MNPIDPTKLTSPHLGGLLHPPGLLSLQFPDVSSDNQKYDILIADDDPVSGMILTGICLDLGATCVQAFNGDEAVDKLTESSFDFAVVDLHMPGRDGLAVLKSIREQSCEVEMPVIIVTSDNDRESALCAFEYGANDYITKPFDSATVRARIRTHLRMQHMQRQLSESNLRYELAMQGTNDGLWDWDLKARKVYYSPRWQAMLGFDEMEYYGAPEHWFQRIHEDDQVQVLESLHLHLGGNTTQFDAELRMLNTSDEYLWVLCRGKAIFDKDGNAVRMAGSLTDVTKAKSVDAVTGLPNRALLIERIKRRFEKFTREPSNSFAILYIDLDNFKTINDTYGHAAGDFTLATISRRIENSIRRGDSILARIGGDELAVIFEDISTKQQAETILDRLAQAIRQPLPIRDDVEITPTASLGLAFANEQMSGYQDLLDSADSAMYDAKRLGKDRYCIKQSEE